MDLFEMTGVTDGLPDWADNEIKVKINRLEQCNALQNYEIIAYTECVGLFMGRIIVKRKISNPNEMVYRGGDYNRSFERGSVFMYPLETEKRRLKLERSPHQFGMNCPEEERHEHWRPWIWKSDEHERKFLQWFEQTYPDVEIPKTY